MNYYLVVLKNVPQALTYQYEEDIPVGSLVRVNLANKTAHGMVLQQVEQPAYDCVHIQEILIAEALSPLQIELCQWMSSYYFASLKRCLQLFIPSVIWNNKLKPKHEQFLALTTPLETALDQAKRSKKQQELLTFLAERDSVSLEDAKQHSSSAIISALLKKGLISQSEGELINPDGNHPSKTYHDQPLTEEQQAVLKALNEDRQHRSTKNLAPGPWNFLLHGITGSGKTEIYLQLIKEQIEADRQCLLMVPEIALTTELIQYFTEHFPDQISILHSNRSERERVQAWHRIHQGQTKLILGSRSAFFTPWKNLGCIIIDEEHEWTYKQESSPRYHLRKVAEQIIQLSEVGSQMSDVIPQLILGSATPSIESYYATQKKPDEKDLRPQTSDFRLLTMSKRANASKLPPVHIVDLREEYHKKNFSMFSERLQEGIETRLKNNEQVILFLNKRGSSSSLTCRDCGFTPKCTDCDISLTYHSKLRDFQGGGLICHYCGLYEDLLERCPDCKSAAIKYFGSGTQKAEEQLQQLFPEARILRADKDTTGGKYDFEQIYHTMRRGEADILIGTQMIAKGLDLPNVTLTGVLLADIGLHLPDFRASERVFQLLTQVAGRSGRHKPGEVVIQTYQPDHPAIQAAAQHDYVGFYEQEQQTRSVLNYPPFCQSIKLTFAHENPNIAEEEAIRLYGILQDSVTPTLLSSPSSPSLPSIELAPNYIAKLHGKYLWNILIRGENPRELVQKLRLERGWKIDVDPLS